MAIKTFIFIDSETTGLPLEENNTTKITELSLCATSSEHLSLGVIPRVQNKVTLCFNPRKLIGSTTTDITGLSNHLLEYKPQFDAKAVNIIQNFISIHQQPICFVAHNGNRFDYPILRKQLHAVSADIALDVFCIDSLLAFRDLHQQDLDLQKQNIPVELNDGLDELLFAAAEAVENASFAKLAKVPVQTIQILNETTPKKKVQITASSSSTGCRRRLQYPRASFKLVDVYTRLTSKAPIDAHKAECDVTMLIECATTYGDRFVNWAEKNAIKFSEIPMMKPGKTVGT